MATITAIRKEKDGLQRYVEIDITGMECDICGKELARHYVAHWSVCGHQPCIDQANKYLADDRS